MKHLLKILSIVALTILSFSCDKDEVIAAIDPTVTFKAMLMGSNESTPNASTAMGNGTLVFNKLTKTFTLTVTHTLSTVTIGHIHKGAVGQSGPVVFPFTSLASPLVYTSAVLDATQEADLNAGLYYINLHSAAFPAGEIRGQLVK